MLLIYFALKSTVHFAYEKLLFCWKVAMSWKLNLYNASYFLSLLCYSNSIPSYFKVYQDITILKPPKKVNAVMLFVNATFKSILCRGAISGF